MRRALILGSAATLCLSLTACPKDNGEPVTNSEAALAIEESTLSSQAQELTSSSVEIATNFTLGGAVSAAVTEIKNFIATQLPCADIVLANATLTITYGAKPGVCIYRGHTYSGQHVVTVLRTDSNDVEVDHQWKDLSNGVLKVNGTAQVTWSFSAASRRVKHDVVWTRISDARTGHGTGDETRKTLTGGIAEGIRVDGTRAWDGQNGHWDLGINGVEWRWIDPVPQAGNYTLAMPNKKNLTLAFARVDDTRIRVTLTSGDRTFTFVVAKTGQITGS